MTTIDLNRLHELPDGAMLNSTEAAAFLGLSPAGLGKLRARRVIPYCKVSGTCVRYRIGDLRRWIEARQVPAESAA